MWMMPNEHTRISELIGKTIPPESTVSTIEPGWPYLYKYKKIVTYPFNIETSDFLIVNYEKKDSFKYFGYISYLGEEITEKANKCLLDKIILGNFDINNPIILNSSMAILKK